MNVLNNTHNVEMKRPSGIIAPMPELDEMLTTRQAYELAQEMDNPVSRSAITQAAKRGMEGNSDSGIEGAVKMGGETSAWLLPRDSFMKWLQSHRTWGKKSKA